MNQPPRIIRDPPGPSSLGLARRLSAVESRNVTYLGPDFPIFLRKSRGSNVWDVDGNRYVDLTAGFAVAATGHRHRRVVKAVRDQLQRLPHAMGDVHPPAVKTRLLTHLCELAPMEDVRCVLATSGAEAVEAALKTSRLATGKPGVIAFTGAYHGLTYGALSVTDRDHFRAPFADQLNPHVLRAPCPHPFRPPPELAGEDEPGATALDRVARLLESPSGSEVGAVIVEPIQGRGGDVVPPAGFLSGLRDLADDHGILLILDEVYTGFGRTGDRFACEHEGVRPDLLCVGKAMSSMFPISACLGTAEVMDAWPPSDGEAIHTTTFLGHPLGCAASLASLGVIEREGLIVRSAEEGTRWMGRLEDLASRHSAIGHVRGRGLMIGIDLVKPGGNEPDPELAGHIVTGALRRGWLLLAGGPHGNVLSLSPPLNIDRALLDAAATVLDDLLSGKPGGG